ncbi:hypothetical protein SEA_FINDLEY_44 [Mycobacterium phage Findley]|uniref:Uncharacterized protein n=1 Tax=Mycobacterium phage Findley TaxID=2015882 RepID=A0A222ZPW2_9CAUD|nr:hypothetical protein MILLY_44 [Mycobacterium phage Milly]YP_009951130.1 hypothetical protein I5G77_gp44 [Mycobacterium phage Findley]AJA43717.1 hypothetical protein MILLY_44 [Mycobacterium phage Milly]ASR86784.1 hypothetical protein SEA_FINDLEY_44 [Mycobacterium phage Findley]
MDKREWMRRGVDVMMAWTEADSDGAAFTTERVMEYVDDPEGVLPLTVGLINLAGILLGNLGRWDSEKMRAILRDLAARSV